MSLKGLLGSGSVAETLQLLGASSNSEVKALAGGTDLVTLMKAGIVAPQQLIDIAQSHILPSGIKEGDDGLVLGAPMTLAGCSTRSAM